LTDAIAVTCAAHRFNIVTNMRPVTCVKLTKKKRSSNKAE
jgi:hypothetical protein